MFRRGFKSGFSTLPRSMDDVAVTRNGTCERVRDRKVGFVPGCCPKPSRLLLGL